MAKFFSLGRTERLKSRKAIGQLFAEGRRFGAGPLRVIFVISKDVPAAGAKNFVLQAGFSVPSRNFRKAVYRNRVKRLMKEAYRLQKIELQEALKEKGHCLRVFFIYNNKDLPSYGDIYEKMGIILKKLRQQVNETGPSNS